MTKVFRVLLGTALVLAAALLGTTTSASAADGNGSVVIDHSEHTDGNLKLLVSVPATGQVDLGSIQVTVGGVSTDATATAANDSTDIRRSTLLAIDTSKSMEGARIREAKKAANTFLDTVPDNVEVGVVTFDSDVQVRQTPSLDRAATRSIIDGLTLKLQTSLYSGVRTAVQTLADVPGQRQVLVLSDGSDSTKTALAPLVRYLKKNDVRVDVVALDQGNNPPAALTAMAEATSGKVIPANTDALTAAFTSEAETLARQIAVTATVPQGQTASDATVGVSLAVSGTTYTGSAFVEVRDPEAAPPAPVTDPFANQRNASNFQIPTPVLYGAFLAIGLGALGVVFALATDRGEETISLDDQMRIYSASEENARISRSKLKQPPPSMSLTDTARAAAEKALSTNVGLEARIAQRLEAAGMALKSSEWLLLHISLAFLAGIGGLLLSGGSPIAMLLFLFLGLVGPWAYLAVKRSRRLKAFDSGLADTLQLMAGSLSAGLSLAQSMDTIVREGTEPITSEFKRAIVESRLGVGLEDALEGVAARMQSTDFKWVVMAIRIQREVGGNLAELLLSVAATLREREYLRRHVRALSAEGRLSTWILGGLPPGFLGYLALSKPDYVHPMFTTPIGWLMLTAMAILLVVGIFWMSKVSKVEV